MALRMRYLGSEPAFSTAPWELLRSVIRYFGVRTDCLIPQVHGSCTDDNYVQTADVT